MAGKNEEIICQGLLGWVRKSEVNERFFVLKESSFDFFATEDDAKNGDPPAGSHPLDDFEELDLVKDGFILTVSGNKKIELRCETAQDLKRWADALTPLFEVDDDEDEEDDEDEIEEDVIFDSSLELDLDGQRVKKHFFLFADRLEYMENEDDQEAEASFPLSKMKAVTVQKDGFQVDVVLSKGLKKLTLYCGRAESEPWINALVSTHEKERAARTNNGSATRNNPKNETKEEPKPAPPQTNNAQVPDPSKGKLDNSASPQKKDQVPSEDPKQTKKAEEKAVPRDESLKQESGQGAQPKATETPSPEPKYNPSASSSPKEPVKSQPSAPVKSDGKADVTRGKPTAQSPAEPAPVSAVQPSATNRRPDRNQTVTQMAPKGRQPLCRNYLGVFQRGREDRRYFVLFEDTFEYYGCQEDYESGVEARGSVSNYTIANLEAFASSEYQGYLIHFENSSRLELRCKTMQEQNLWLEQWNALLQNRIGPVTVKSLQPRNNVEGSNDYKVANQVITKAETLFGDEKMPVKTTQAPQQTALLRDGSIPTFNNGVSPDQQTSNFAQKSMPTASYPSQPSSVYQRDTSPVPAARQIPGWPDLPGLVFMGSLVIEANGRPKRRHFALFDNRLDYFEVASDMVAERYPRGRILLRDILSLEFNQRGFQLTFRDEEVPNMVLVVDRADLPTWEMAWSKVRTQWEEELAAYDDAVNNEFAEYAQDSEGARRPQQRAKPCPAPRIRGALIQGALSVVRPNSSKPEQRYWVLFSDRLDCFYDEATASRGRVLESVLKKDIQDIDIVDQGFNIISSSRRAGPMKLRVPQGGLPNLDHWIEALSKALSR
jgi:hypothetical protein